MEGTERAVEDGHNSVTFDKRQLPSAERQKSYSRTDDSPLNYLWFWSDNKKN